MAKVNISYSSFILRLAAGFSCAMVLGCSADQVTEAAAIGKLRVVLSGLGVSGASSKHMADLRILPRTSIWVVKLVYSDGTIYTGHVDAYSGAVRMVNSSILAKRVRGEGRTGHAYFAGVAAVAAFSSARIKTLLGSQSFEVLDVSLVPDRTSGSATLAGKASFSFRKTKGGYPFVFPAGVGSVVFDCQDGKLLSYTNSSATVSTSAVPSAIITRNQACQKAFGRVIPKDELEGEVCGWSVPPSGTPAVLAYTFHSRRESVTIQADTGAVLYRLTKK